MVSSFSQLLNEEMSGVKSARQTICLRKENCLPQELDYNDFYQLSYNKEKDKLIIKGYNKPNIKLSASDLVDGFSDLFKQGDKFRRNDDLQKETNNFDYNTILKWIKTLAECSDLYSENKIKEVLGVDWSNISAYVEINEKTNEFISIFEVRDYPDCIYFCNFAIMKKYRGLGRSKNVLKFAENIAFNKVKDLELTVYAENLPAYKSYTNYGFKYYKEDK